MNYHTLDLYRNTQVPLVGTGGYPWHWPGSCLTAQSTVIPLSVLPYLHIIAAKWRLTWNPNINSTDQTAVRLVSCYNGPVDIVQRAAFFRSNCVTPQNDAIDILADVKSAITQAIADQQDLQFTHQVVGNGAVGPQIYSSAIELVTD